MNNRLDILFLLQKMFYGKLLNSNNTNGCERYNMLFAIGGIAQRLMDMKPS